MAFGKKKKAEQAMNEARDAEMNQYRELVGMYEPYNELAKTMTTDFADYYNRGGYQFDPSSVMIDDPGYQYRQQQGMSGIENSAMARGGLMSGNTVKASQQFGQDLASQEYGNSYNRAYERFNKELGTRQGMLDWSMGMTDKMGDIKALDPTARHKMQDAEKYASQSKGIGRIVGNTALGFATGGLSTGLGAAGGGLLGGMF